MTQLPVLRAGDLLLGTRTTQIVTLVERQARFVRFIKVPSAETMVVVGALTAMSAACLTDS